LGGNLATLTHGNGIASLSYNGTANVTVGLQTLTNDGTGSFVKINRDTYGRISGTTPVTSGDITGLVNFPNITAGKTFAVTNTLTLSGTDGSTLNVGTGGTLGSNAYTSTSYEPAISKATGYATWNGSAWAFVNETYSLSTHDHTGVYSPVHSHPYEPTITKATGYAKWNGSAWVFVDETYSLSGHTHSYEPANANIQSHISNTSNPHSTTKSQVGLGNVLDVAQEPAITKATGYAKWNGSAWVFVNDTYEAANANIQSHISSTSNPHGVTANQVLPSQTTHNTKYLQTDGTNVSWQTVVGAGAIHENDAIIAANYTLTTGKNGFSVGPITVNSGVTVTVPSGQRWAIL
jgi:hypothetical protein